jgi:HAMP domain-containing protein
MSIAYKLLALIVLLAAVAGGAAYTMHRLDVTQEQADMAAVQKKLDQQQIDAATALRQAQEHITELAQANLKTNNQLEAQHEDYQRQIVALRHQLDASKLQYRAPATTGGGSGSTVPTPDGVPANVTAAIVQLPDSITIDLRQLAEDADALNADYQTCYNAVHPGP